MKQSKQNYYTKYFENNWNNIKNTWKGIKTIISIKNITATVPHSIEFNNKTITDPTAIIISSLDSHKSSVPNSIPLKILKLLKNDISQ